jgi:hypothetical protein
MGPESYTPSEAELVTNIEFKYELESHGKLGYDLVVHAFPTDLKNREDSYNHLTITFRPDEKSAYLDLINIEPSLQGKGLGEKYFDIIDQQIADEEAPWSDQIQYLDLFTCNPKVLSLLAQRYGLESIAPNPLEPTEDGNGGWSKELRKYRVTLPKDEEVSA